MKLSRGLASHTGAVFTRSHLVLQKMRELQAGRATRLVFRNNLTLKANLVEPY